MKRGMCAPVKSFASSFVGCFGTTPLETKGEAPEKRLFLDEHEILSSPDNESMTDQPLRTFKTALDFSISPQSVNRTSFSKSLVSTWDRKSLL